MKMQNVQFKLNGDVVERDVDPHWTLLDLLRDKLNLTGTREGCRVGDCGACTVILDGSAYNSCLILAVELEGRSVRTIEGLEKNGNLHPVQEAFASHGAVQCGYCTPGMVMSTVALLENNRRPSEDEVRLKLAGNICRCTGYAKIVQAVLAVSDSMNAAEGEKA